MTKSFTETALLSLSFFITLCLLCWLGLNELNMVPDINIEQHSRSMVMAIIAAITFLLVASLIVGLHLRRARAIAQHQKQLEELLYYDQLSEAIQPQSTAHLPTPLVQLQNDPVLFANALQQALEQEQFVLHYQPIVSADNEQIVEVEALLYWQHPIFGLLNPGFFLPFCEKSGFITALGDWVLRHACLQIKKWHAMGYQHLSVSVNLSPRQLHQTNLYQTIKDTLESTQLAPHHLKLEVTESCILHNVEANIAMLTSLREMGLQLALDDFGTGYSALNYLKKFPFNIIKIDRSFIADMATNITSVAIVKSIIQLGKSLGLVIVAEGIEEKHQLQMLKKMKCDLIQGYLFSKPVSADQFTHLLAQSKQQETYKPITSLVQGDYSYETLKKEHFDQAVNVITQTFCDHEPMTNYLGITHHEFIPFAKLMVQKAIEDGLSIVAVNNGNVAACTIVEDIADPLTISIDIDPRFKIIFSLLEHLGSDFFHEKVIEKGHMAHLFITAVDKNLHGRGLSRKINFESIQLAKQKGFDFMCCEFTHHYNEKGTVKNIKNSKLLIRSCRYKEFIFEGKKPFEHLDGHASAYIWELREGATLKYQM